MHPVNATEETPDFPTVQRLRVGKDAGIDTRLAVSQLGSTDTACFCFRFSLKFRSQSSDLVEFHD